MEGRISKGSRDEGHISHFLEERSPKIVLIACLKSKYFLASAFVTAGMLLGFANARAEHRDMLFVTLEDDKGDKERGITKCPPMRVAQIF